MVTTTGALGVTVGVLTVFTVLGVWYSRGRVESVEDYITARNTTGLGATTATLIASSMGAWILLSPAEAGAAFGGISAVIGYAVGSAFPLTVYMFLGPRIRELIPKGHSLTEYAYARYGSAMYAYVLLVSVFYMFIFLSAEMTGIAGALSLVAGVPGWQTASLIGAFVLVYTAYGGLRASIFTDTVQTLVILPLLAVGFGGALLALGGTGEIHKTVSEANPQLLNPGYVSGLKFGFYVIIAILGAEMLNQSWWQRIYASESSRTLKKSFGVAALAVVPMVFLSGLFGLVAQGRGLVEGGNAKVAFFLVVNDAFPEWVTLAVVVLAILLVMSTADTLFNAISSIVTADLPRLLNDPGQSRLKLGARLLTAVVALGATFIGAQGYSVLTLFFTADLLATATFIPLLHGLYSSRANQTGVLVSSVAGLLVGAAFFPPFNTFLGFNPFELSFLNRYLISFTAAAGVSGLLTYASTVLTDTRFNLDNLATEIRSLEEPSPDGGTDEGGEYE